MKNLLFRRYQRVMRRAAGGSLNVPGAGPYTELGSLGSGLIDAVDQPDQYGYQSKGATIGKSVLSDAGTGAAIGSVIPGVGTLVGAGVGATVGLVSGYLKSKSNSAGENNARNSQYISQRQQETQRSNATLANDPALATGTSTSYFSDGGSIHIKPSHKGRFTKYLSSHHTTLSAALHSKSPHVRQMANFANNAKHWKHEYGGELSKYVLGGGLTGDWAPAVYGKDLTANPRTPLNDLITSGGDAKKLSSDNAIIQGNSHAEGGIQIPELNAEVEGGETTLGDFVFSKKLGFADQHKPIATAKGIIEKKPQTLERANSMRLLRDKEQRLATQQETLKKYLNIQ